MPASTRATNVARTAIRCQAANDEPAGAFSRRALLSTGVALGAATTMQPVLPAQANRLLSGDWELVNLPLDPGVVLLDIGFTGSDPNHGKLLFFSTPRCSPKTQTHAPRTYTLE